MSSYLRKSTKRTAAPRSSSRERDLWLSPYGQPDALRSSKRDRAQQRAKDRQRAQRIAQNCPLNRSVANAGANVDSECSSVESL